MTTRLPGGTADRPRICIVGGGVAGLSLASYLGEHLGRKSLARVTLVDRGPTHVWKPMLHTFAAGTWDIHQQEIKFLAHALSHHFEYVPGAVCDLDRAQQRICLAPMDVAGERIMDTRWLDYDVLILAFGSCANDFGTPGVTEHCHFIDSQRQAEGFNEQLRAHAARCVMEGDVLDIAIVGGGATGVELAAELSRAQQLADGYGYSVPGVQRTLKLTLMEGAERILGAFPERVAESATAQLRRLGVEVRTGVKVVGAERAGFRLADGELVPATLKVWAAGVKASSALTALSGLETNGAGQLHVSSSLQVVGEDTIFALGDCACLQPAGQARPLPATAQVANQQALHLMKHLPRWLDGQAIPPFEFRDFGALVSLSDYNAFGTLGRLGFFKGGFIKGRFAQLSHAWIYRRHQLELHGLWRCLVLWAAERINALVQPRIRMD